MKRILLSLRVACFVLFGIMIFSPISSVHASTEAQIKINKKNFPDQKFRWYVIRKFDKNKNGSLSKREIKAVKKIVIGRDFYAGWGGASVLNLQGMEYFTNMRELWIFDFRLKNFDLPKMKKLKELHLFNSPLKVLDLRKNNDLTTLELHRNKITKIKFASDSQLKYIEIDHEKRLQKPNFASLKKLEVLRAEEMPYKKLNLRKCKKLKSLTWCGDRLKRGVLQKISLGKSNKKLKVIDIDGGKLTSAEWLYKLPNLEVLDLSYNNFTALDVSKNSKLKSLSCSSNPLKKLDISKLAALETLICNENDLTALDLTKNSKLNALYCSKNNLTALDLSQNTMLARLDCSKNHLRSLDLSRNGKLIELNCSKSPITNLDISALTDLKMLDCSNCQLTALDTSANKRLIKLNSEGNLFK